MATAEIKARATLDKAGFDAGVSAMQRSAINLRNVIAGAFSVGAIASFAKSSLNYAAQFQDIADQFGISASSASALSIALQRVGGSSEKTSAILRGLAEKQQESGMTMDQYVQSVMEAYKTTQDYGAVVDAVGTRNAPVFIAAMREMEYSLEAYKQTAMGVVSDVDAAFADSFGEKLDAHLNTAKSGFARFTSFIFDQFSAVAADIGGLMGGGMKFGEGYNNYFAAQQLEQTVKEGEFVARQLELANRKRDIAGQTGLSDPLSGLRSIIGAIAGAQGSIINQAGLLSGAAAQKPSQEIEREERIRYDALRRIGGNLPGGANDPTRKASEKLVDLTKQLLDEAKKANGNSGKGARF